jgi:hypothetical protein
MNQVNSQFFITVCKGTEIPKPAIFSVIRAVLSLVIIRMEVVFRQSVSELAVISLFAFIHFFNESPVA